MEDQFLIMLVDHSAKTAAKGILADCWGTLESRAQKARCGPGFRMRPRGGGAGCGPGVGCGQDAVPGSGCGPGFRMRPQGQDAVPGAGCGPGGRMLSWVQDAVPGQEVPSSSTAFRGCHGGRIRGS